MTDIITIKANLVKAWTAKTDRSRAIHFNRAKRDFIKGGWAGWGRTTEDDFAGFADEYFTAWQAGR